MTAPRMTPGEMWQALAHAGAAVLFRPVSLAELEDAERELQLRFPPSYRSLVLDVGAPAFLPAPTSIDDVADLPFAVLTPAEAVKLTLEWRDSEVVHDPDMFEDPASSARVVAQLQRAVFFARQSDPNDAYVFLLDDTAGGEYRVADFAHDYLEELAWDRPPTSDGPVWATLGDVTAFIMQRITAAQSEEQDPR